jgi:hypothetical protein
MKYKQKRLTQKQHMIKKNADRDTQLANYWLTKNGIDEQYLHIGIPQLYIAMKLARKAIDDHACLLSFDKLDFLKKFITDASYVKRRQKIRQGRCFKVMNICKQAIRKASQQR